MRKPVFNCVTGKFWRQANRLPLCTALKFLQDDEIILGPAFAPPRMNKHDVIREATRFCRLLSDHPYRLQYGSYHDWSTRQGTTQADGTTAWQTASAFDAWKVTVTKLAIPRPGGRPGGTVGPPRRITRLVLVIDDKTGRYYAAQGV